MTPTPSHPEQESALEVLIKDYIRTVGEKYEDELDAYEFEAVRAAREERRKLIEALKENDNAISAFGESVIMGEIRKRNAALLQTSGKAGR